MSTETIAEKGPVYGFYRSRDGREFLRELYPLFLKAKGIGNSKAVSPIFRAADQRALPQPAEEERLAKERSRAKEALKRWSSGQPELWRDNAKRDRVLSGVEAEMEKVPEIRDRMDKHFASQHKREIGTAFGRFFYGADFALARSPKVLLTKANVIGLHQIFHTRQSGDGSWHEPVMTLLESDQWFIRFEEVPNEAFLIVHMFKFTGLAVAINGTTSFPDDDRRKVSPERYAVNGFQYRRSGFAYPLPSGEVHCLLADYGPPRLRTYCVWGGLSTDEWVMWQGEHRDEKDLIFHYSEKPTYPGRKTPADIPGRWFPEGKRLWRRPDKMVERVITVKLDALNWDIVL